MLSGLSRLCLVVDDGTRDAQIEQQEQQEGGLAVLCSMSCSCSHEMCCTETDMDKRVALHRLVMQLLTARLWKAREV